MRYRLRTLLVVTTIGPPILAGAWLFLVRLGIDPRGPMLLGAMSLVGLGALAVVAQLYSPQKPE